MILCGNFMISIIPNTFKQCDIFNSNFMILIDSLYINNSGGKVLLDYLVDELEKARSDVFYLFDSRVKGSYNSIPEIRKTYLKASIINRANFYRHHQDQFQKVLCFGNIPPLFKVPKSQVYTYFHNTLILRTPQQYQLKNKITVNLQKLFIWLSRSNTDKWIVQSSNVASELQERLAINPANIVIIPFFNAINQCNEGAVRSKSFVYASTGASHKNHDRLLAAWVELFNDGKDPELHLTIPPGNPVLIEKIVTLNQRGLRIRNHGVLPYSDLLDLYCQNEFIIYPSLSESFGLPLIEGVKSGCKIIASDLPYTYAVVQPSLTFNPYIVSSIKEAVCFALDNSLPESECVIKNEIELLIKLLS